MYKEIFSYELAEGVTEEKFLQVANRIHEVWMSKQSGFVGWEINKEENGTYTDIVYWKSKDDAKNSETTMKDIPNVQEWFSCYNAPPISSKKLEELAHFP
ncbi:hypothetical protein H6501_03790 [Candidatus Woesearchaeota archaeon]|nr:hypothetical protein [Nanoarchaeota archaeon]MCB9370693.1 hypothetical protein [Candidatus Woesearchaeota archaeon]USN43777.1 MAG: hypothetical protein H6500_05290 [Candidatus Woesearchaeota archaeon]